MYRFKEKSRPLDLPALDLRLIDSLTLPDDDRAKLIHGFNEEFGVFINTGLPDVRVCDTNAHIENLLTAYLDEEEVLRRNGQPVPLLEDWSRLNFHLWMVDYASAPHEGVFWYELRSIQRDEPVGKLTISQINKIKESQEELVLSGHVLMTLKDHPTLSYAEYWGEIMKELLDKPFISLDDEKRSWLFDEFVFPTGPKARYTTHPGFTFLDEVVTVASDGILIEREDTTKEFAPKNIRKTVRGA